MTEPIEALPPRDAEGGQLVCYGDCCSGVAGTIYERNLAVVNGVLARLYPAPQYILFAGDEIMGLTEDYAALRAQWRYWREQEMAWLDTAVSPLYHVPSNHTTYDAASEDVWREAHPEVPPNGPPDQMGLSYALRRGNLLLVGVNTAYSALGGSGHVEHAWLEQTLTEHADAPFKLVMGHHPVHAVNGYDEYPRWRIVPEEGAPFWATLRRHGVLAYICSHVIAFDVQAHDGVLQITTGGAGTLYGPGGYMPGSPEYLHLVQLAYDRTGLRYQVLDAEGVRREQLEWPPPEPDNATWRSLAAPLDGAWDTTARRLVHWHAVAQSVEPVGQDQTLVCGWHDDDGPPTIWIGITGSPPCVTARLQLRAGFGVQTWVGPMLVPGAPLDLSLAIHTDMGPGGILACGGRHGPWTSFTGAAALGAEEVRWPALWLMGHGRSGPADTPFRAPGLYVEWQWKDLL